MLILFVNLSAWVFIFLITIISYYFSYVRIKEHKSLLIIILVSFFVAISVILTNVVSYNIKFFPTVSPVQLSFGSFLLFIIGMLFGPFFGCVAGIATDSIGAMININGAYCAIFTLDAVLYGFIGSLPFLFKTKRRWYFEVIISYVVLFFLISFGLDLLYDYAFFGPAGIAKTIIIKLIKFPVEIAIYLPLIFSLFTTLHYLLNLRLTVNLWCDRLGTIEILFKKKYNQINC